MRPINRTLTMLVFDRVEMSVIEMANPRGHRDVPTLHSYMTVSCAVRKFEEDQKNVVTLELTPRFRAQQYRGAQMQLPTVLRTIGTDVPSESICVGIAFENRFELRQSGGQNRE